MQTSIVIFILFMYVAFLVIAWRAEDRAFEAEQKYKRLRTSLAQLELELVPKFKVDDPEFCAGWNLAMGHIKTMVREIKKHA